MRVELGQNHTHLMTNSLIFSLYNVEPFVNTNPIVTSKIMRCHVELNLW